MITVTLDELEVNAVRAALSDRIEKMGRQLCDLKEHRDTPDNAFAIEATRDAIRCATRTQLRLDGLIADVVRHERVELVALLEAVS